MSLPGQSDALSQQLTLLLAAASGLPGSLLTQPGMLGDILTPNAAITNPYATALSSSLQAANINPVGLPSVENLCLVLDGNSALRYPEPDVKSLVYDPAVGYRFDPATGLHYDANSCLFINTNLGLLLRYDKLNNIYIRAGTTADLTVPVLAKEFAELMGYNTAQSAPQLPPHASTFASSLVIERSPCYGELPFNSMATSQSVPPSLPQVSPLPSSLANETNTSYNELLFNSMSAQPVLPSSSHTSLIPSSFVNESKTIDDKLLSGPVSTDSLQVDCDKKTSYSPQYSPSPPQNYKRSPSRNFERTPSPPGGLKKAQAPPGKFENNPTVDAETMDEPKSASEDGPWSDTPLLFGPKKPSRIKIVLKGRGGIVPKPYQELPKVKPFNVPGKDNSGDMEMGCNSKQVCVHCSKPGHTSNNCVEPEPDSCNKPGHLEADCPNTSSIPSELAGPQTPELNTAQPVPPFLHASPLQPALIHERSTSFGELPYNPLSASSLLVNSVEDANHNPPYSETYFQNFNQTHTAYTETMNEYALPSSGWSDAMLVGGPNIASSHLQMGLKGRGGLVQKQYQGGTMVKQFKLPGKGNSGGTMVSSKKKCGRALCSKLGHTCLKSKRKCYICKQFGHLASHCPNTPSMPSELAGVQTPGSMGYNPAQSFPPSLPLTFPPSVIHERDTSFDELPYSPMPSGSLHVDRGVMSSYSNINAESVNESESPLQGGGWPDATLGGGLKRPKNPKKALKGRGGLVQKQYQGGTKVKQFKVPGKGNSGDTRASSNSKQDLFCAHCSKSGHSTAKCYIQKRKCYTCNELGHLASTCPNSSSMPPELTGPQTPAALRFAKSKKKKKAKASQKQQDSARIPETGQGFNYDNIENY